MWVGFGALPQGWVDTRKTPLVWVRHIPMGLCPKGVEGWGLGQPRVAEPVARPRGVARQRTGFGCLGIGVGVGVKTLLPPKWFERVGKYYTRS